MLEKPPITDDKIIHCLQSAYGLHLERLDFLPLGADLNTAVFRAAAKDGAQYFVKLRGGPFALASVMVPKFLSDQGLRQIIPPLPARTGQLWAELAPYKVILYPYVEGWHGFERNLSDNQWVEFGAAVQRFHSTGFPQAVTDGIPREDLSPRWRDAVRTFLARVDTEPFTEPLAVETAAFLQAKREEILDLVRQAEGFAQRLQEQPADYIVCHGDMHAWNLLVTDDGKFYMVDWDTLIFAPKERDLMFIGAGLGGGGHTPQEEETLFYQGYGAAGVDPAAIAYYRCERIIEDIAVFCEQIFLTDEGGEDRQQALVYLKSNFLPGGTIELARQSNKKE
jgi:spectinomycin phosphotransferase